MKIIEKIRKIAAYLLKQIPFVFGFCINYTKIDKLNGASMLSKINRDKYRRAACPVCGSGECVGFIEFPINLPEGQGHSLLYYDYSHALFGDVSKAKKMLDKYLGLSVSARWEFCNNCKNAFIDVCLDDAHLDLYYSKYYKRERPAHPLRANTKIKHGEYLASLLAPGDKILEIGAAEGYTSAYLAKHGFKMHANELSESLKAQLKEKKGVVVIDDIVSVLDEEYDCIFMHHVLEHINKPKEFLELINQKLKKDGILFVQVPDISSQLPVYLKYFRGRLTHRLFNPYKTNLDEVDYKFNENGCHWLDALNNDHIIAYTGEGLKNLFEACGFDIRELKISDRENIVEDKEKYAWPIDEKTGNTPNGLTVIGIKK